MIINVLHFLDSKTVQQSDEDEVQFSVSKERSGTHAVAHAVREDWGIGLLNPAVRPENFWIAPYVGIC
jgi:hypothetical protein